MTIRILFLAANPRNMDQLGLDRELRNIQDELRAAKHGDEFEFESVWAVRPKDLQRVFDGETAQIVHYSGHGSKEHELFLLDEQDQARRVPKEALARLFEPLRRKTRVVFFNACYAEGQADAVTEHVDCAIGMSKAVGDRAAIALATEFYRSLASDKSIKASYESGLNAIDLQGIAGRETPRLVSRQGVDPATVYLLRDARRRPLVPEAWREHLPEAEDPREPLEWHATLGNRSDQEPWCVSLRDVLRDHGFKVFTPRTPLPDGNTAGEGKEKGLDRAAAGLLVWSGRAEDVGWLRGEWRAMEARAEADPDFRFLPLQLAPGQAPDFCGARELLDFSAHQNGPGGGELLRLVYAILGQPLPEHTARFAAEQETAAREASAAIAAALKKGDHAALLELFGEGGLVWETSAALGCEVAQALIDLGHNGDALDVTGPLRERFPRALRPVQLHALALARRRDPKDLRVAHRILGRLAAGGDRDPETLGLYARTWMDLYERSQDEDDLEESRDHYAEAFEKAPDNTYVGINAAAKSAMLGERDEAREFAERTRAVLAAAADESYWALATQAEASLILGEHELAARQYKDARRAAKRSSASHESTWRQACRLRAPLEVEDDAWRAIRNVFKKFPDFSE